MYDRRGKSRLIEFIKASIAFKDSVDKTVDQQYDFVLTEELEGLQETLSKINMYIAYIEHNGKLVPCIQHKKPMIIYMDELTEEPQNVHNKQPKSKAHRHVPDGSVAQWKHEINPRKH